MANTIRIKRRPSTGSAGAPSSASLYNGELAFNENDNTLYYAYGSGVNGISQSVPAIAGSGAYALRGGTNATGTWPIGITGNSATVTNGVYTTGDQTIEGTKIFYGSGTNGSLVAIKSETNYPASLSFMEGSSLPKISFIWDGSVGVNKFKLNTGSAPATAFTFQVNTHLEVRATGTSSSATNIPVFISNPNSSAQTIYTRTPSELKSDIGLSNVTNDIQVKQTTGGTTVGYLPTWNSTSGELLAAGYAVSTNLVTNSGSTHIPRADSVVNYVSSGLANHVHGNITNDGKIGSTANLPLITTTNGTITTGSFGSTANTFCQGNDSRLSDTRNTTNSITVNDGGAGDSSSFTFNGSAAKTISYNSVGAPSQTGALASGSNWNISILGNSATVTNGVYTSRTLNAGSGLVGGGDLSSDRTFNIGQGDGISVSADSIAVDNTVVRSTSVNVSGYIPTWAATNSKTLNVGYQISTNLDTNNNSSFIPRADAVKTYVDSMIGSGIATNDAMIFKGAIDCSTNPNYPAADRGWTYKVSVAGKIGGASGPTVEVNDTLICTTDGTSAGTHAVVGSNWVILQTNIVDASILVTGPTSATSGNIAMFDGSTGKIIKDGGFLASNIVLTTGTQTINGSKTFADGLTVGNNVGNLLAGTSGVRFTHSQINFQIDAGNLNPGFDGDALRLDVDSGNGTGYTTTLKTSAPSSDITLRLPSSSGVLARLEDITTTNITGVLGATKGGTGQSSYAIGDLLYANTTTSLAKLADVATGNVLLAGGVNTAPSWGKVGLTTHVSGTLPVANGGTNQTSYTDGQLLIGNSTGNTLTKATLTQGTAIDITNGGGSITIGHNDTSTLTGAQGSNGIASFTVDGMGHVTAVTTATYLTSGQSLCDAISNSNCTIDGGTF